jgi:hypothetical protein
VFLLSNIDPDSFAALVVLCRAFRSGDLLCCYFAAIMAECCFCYFVPSHFGGGGGLLLAPQAS